MQMSILCDADDISVRCWQHICVMLMTILCDPGSCVLLVTILCVPGAKFSVFLILVTLVLST